MRISQVKLDLAQPLLPKINVNSTEGVGFIFLMLDSILFVLFVS